MFPILQIGPLAIQVPGLVLLLGLWLGLSLAERHAPHRGVPPNLLYNLVFVALIAAVVGARLTYVLRYPSIFSSDPLGLISLNPGLLDPWGGLVAGTIAALIYGQRKGLEFYSTLDALTPAFAVISIAIGLSHLASGAAFGTTTELPWGIEIWGARRHPTQIYESLAAAMVLALLWPGRERWRDAPPGTYFLTFVALSALARLFLEAFRGDSLLLPVGLRAAQVVAWVVLAASLWDLKKQSQASAPIATVS